MKIKKKLKIAYLCHVDWAWIKQRPQFIAEHLVAEFDVDFYYFKGSSLKRNKSGLPPGLRLISLIKLPFSGRSSFLGWFQRVINSVRFNIIKYDYIWVCSPEIIARVDVEKIDVPIIYDCMDDMIECHKVDKYREILLADEMKLLKIARAVFVSSDSLRNKMIGRGCAPEKISALYNATSLASLFSCERSVEPYRVKPASEKFVVTYFGTISRWIDLQLLYRLLDETNLCWLHVRLIGPTDAPIRAHPRLEYVPPVEHGELYKYAEDTDLFILPFILNEITLSVDPVKIYEYIAFNRNIACIYYPEVERYSEFVKFYSTYDEIKDIIVKCHSDNALSYRIERASWFVDGNTWERRADLIINKLQSLTL